MTDDWLGDSIFGDPDDPAVFFGVPNDHPAFRRPDDDDEGDGAGGDIGEAGNNVVELPIGRYDGLSRQAGGKSHGGGHHNSQEPSGLSGDGDARPGAADQRAVRRTLERRAREEGVRSIREHAVAVEHSGGTEDRSGDSGANEERHPTTELRQQLADSLDAAGVNFRESFGGRGDDPATLEANLKRWIEAPETTKRNGGVQKAIAPGRPLVWAKGVKKVPEFQRCVVRGQLGGLKSNAGGTWILTLAIDPDCVEEVTKLGAAHGLALDIVIGRVVRD